MVFKFSFCEKFRKKPEVKKSKEGGEKKVKRNFFRGAGVFNNPAE